MAFGDRLAAVRRGNGLTQEQFAEQLQVSRQAVSKWESGRGYPEMEKILYICNRYQVSIADLFAEEAPVPAAAAETYPAPEQEAAPLPRATLGSAVGAFLTNLSPKNKWLAGAVLVGIGALAGIIGLILRGGDADMATTIWIAAIIIFGVAEAATAGLTSIWFVLGGVAGLIAAVCGGPVWLQVGLFFAVSIAALAFTRPLVVKLMKKDIKPTNADRVLNNVGRVTERIDNALPSGSVYIDGKTWTARSADGEVIEPDAAVRILRMEGVKLIVQKEP
jgi:membrane protein implicated in regulation of membrane protease activity/transcriptional regulator with XRE-family HTH domain